MNQGQNNVNNSQQPVPQNSKNMVVCKSCGTSIAKSAKVCPSCGAKNKKPVFKRPWFWVLAAIILIVIISSAGGGNKDVADDKPEKVSQTEIDSNSVSETEDDVKETELVTLKDTTTEAPKEYIECRATDLFDALKANALKAKKTYEGKYVEITGYVTNIDASGDYISIGASKDNYDYFLDSIQCYVENDEQLDRVMELSDGEKVTIRGKITTVGEVMGYSLDIESIS